MKIFITGVSGFIGFHLSKKLIKSGHKVIGIDNNNDYYNPELKRKRLSLLDSSNFKFYECDINKITIEDTNFDLAINLAAQAGVRVKEEKQSLYRSTNVDGFESFCTFCLKKGINKIIYASSSSVYSDSGYEKFSETLTDLKPKSTYGKSKLANEAYASHLLKSNNLCMIGLRFFSVYGPFGRPDMAYYAFTKAIKEQKPINLYNNGNMYRDMTYIDDIIDGICGAVDYAIKSSIEKKHEIFNLGNDCPIKTSSLLQKIEKSLGKKASIKNFVSHNEAFRTHADITKARKLIGYNPKVAIDEGMKSFLDWHKYYENI